MSSILQPIIDDGIEAADLLPTEVWTHIYALLDGKREYDIKSVISFSRVCRLFHAINKENFKHLSQMMLSREGLCISRLISTMKSTQVELKRPKALFGDSLTPRILAMEATGQCYFYSYLMDVVYFMDFTSNEGPIELLNLGDTYVHEGQNLKLIPLGDVRHFWLTDNGFILVAEGYLSIWEYDENNELKLKTFINSPSVISSASLHEEIVLLKLSKSNTVLACNLKDTGASQFSSVTVSESLQEDDWRFVGGRSELLIDQGNGYWHSAVIDSERLELVGKPFQAYISTPYRRNLIYGQWAIHCSQTQLIVVNLDENKIWLSKMHNLPREITCFIQKEILFIFQHEDWKADCLVYAIHLPTKKNLTDEWAQVLNPFFSESNRLVLFFLGNGVVDMLLSKQHKITIPDLVRFNLPEDVVKDNRFQLLGKEYDPSSSLASSKHKRTQPKRKKSSRRPIRNEKTVLDNRSYATVPEQKQSPLTSKVILAAGFVFLCLTAGATFTLIILHPGLVVYQGGGLILTMPALLTFSVGGAASLLIIAIGSYRWWKANRRAII